MDSDASAWITFFGFMIVAMGTILWANSNKIVDKFAIDPTMRGLAFGATGGVVGFATVFLLVLPLLVLLDAALNNSKVHASGINTSFVSGRILFNTMTFSTIASAMGFFLGFVVGVFGPLKTKGRVSVTKNVSLILSCAVLVIALVYLSNTRSHYNTLFTMLIFGSLSLAGIIAGSIFDTFDISWLLVSWILVSSSLALILLIYFVRQTRLLGASILSDVSTALFLSSIVACFWCLGYLFCNGPRHSPKYGPPYMPNMKLYLERIIGWTVFGLLIGVTISSLSNRLIGNISDFTMSFSLIGFYVAMGGGYGVRLIGKANTTSHPTLSRFFRGFFVSYIYSYLLNFLLLYGTNFLESDPIKSSQVVLAQAGLPSPIPTSISAMFALFDLIFAPMMLATLIAAVVASVYVSSNIVHRGIKSLSNKKHGLEACGVFMTIAGGLIAILPTILPKILS